MQKLPFYFIVGSMIFFSSCHSKSDKTSDNIKQQQTEILVKEANQQVGMPNIKNFTELKALKELYELRDDPKLICHAYITTLNGKFIYLGKCKGYGIPYSAQFSNPEKVVDLESFMSHDYVGYSLGKIQQPEPNGLFPPTSSSATFLKLQNPKTKKLESKNS